MMAKNYVFEGYVTSVKSDTFWVHLERNDEMFDAEFCLKDIPSEENEYIQEGAYLTVYVRDEVLAIRFCKRRIMRSDIAWADRKAREMGDWFNDDVSFG